MPAYSYKVNRITETMTIYEDGKTLCIMHDITRAVNKKNLFYDYVYKRKGIRLN